MERRMKNIIELCFLTVSNIAVWTINELSYAEMILKIVFLLVSIAIGLKTLASKAKKEK